MIHVLLVCSGHWCAFYVYMGQVPEIKYDADADADDDNDDDD